MYFSSWIRSTTLFWTKQAMFWTMFSLLQYNGCLLKSVLRTNTNNYKLQVGMLLRFCWFGLITRKMWRHTPRYNYPKGPKPTIPVIKFLIVEKLPSKRTNTLKQWREWRGPPITRFQFSSKSKTLWQLIKTAGNRQAQYRNEHPVYTAAISSRTCITM